MTDPVTEYLRREKAAMRTMEGADVEKIMREVADEYCMTFEELREAVLDATIIGGRGG